jgi:hypothetical protein
MPSFCESGRDAAESAFDPGFRHGNEVAAIDVWTIGGKGVDPVGPVQSTHDADSRSAGWVTTDRDHVPTPARPLALRPDELVPEIEDQVVARTVADRLVDLDAELDRSMMIAVSATEPF